MRALILLIVCALLPSVAAAQDFWCWNADEVRAYVDGDQVRLSHLAALLNCCPDPITYDVHVGDVTIFIEERSESPCDCDCCYNLEVALDDVPPGPWILRYRWFDTEIRDWTEQVLQIYVPDVGQPFDTYVAGQNSYGCLDAAPVPEDEASTEQEPRTSPLQPNPFVGWTSMPGSESAGFDVYDVGGRIVGSYRGVRIGSDLPPGVYFVRRHGESEPTWRVVKLQ
jgi:hypothetical protein